MSTSLIRSATSQSGSYPIVLTRLGGPRSRSNPHLKFVEVPGIELLNEHFVLEYIVSMIYIIIHLTPKPTGKRPLGRPRRRGKDNIRMDLEEIGINAGNWVDSA